MSVFLFPDHVIDSRGLIQRAHEARQRTVLVKSFLEKAYFTLREEVWRLPHDIRNQIPPFNSVFDLSERHTASKVQRLEVSSALLCISQLAHFIGHHEQNGQNILDTNVGLLVGTGLGQLCAATVACAASIVDLPNIALEAIRLAFRAGSIVETFSVQTRGDEEWDSSWSIVVPGAFQEIQDELRSIQDSANIPIAGRAFVATISDLACTINGSPARLDWLKRNSRLLNSKNIQSLPTTGVWHAADLYSNDQVSDIIESRTASINQIPSPRRIVISASTGHIIEGQTANALFETIMQDVLRNPVQWSSIARSVVNHAIGSEVAKFQIFGFEECHMTKSLLASLERDAAKLVSIQDITGWSSLTGSRYTSSTSSGIAIVGMSGRFPGAPDVEQLWELLSQGRDMHRKIPKDRFDVETHYDAEAKKNNSSHTPYGCFIEEPGLFDPRFFNMSPREATQTDPMHRLALVTAYEALEQAGFSLNSTPSSQQDRVGTFYGQTSDDWREVNAAQNIETYFIPGGVRAFAPGRISYYFGFRGPSYSVDTACSSSLAAIQVACSSLKAGECDTAIAGGVNVLTAPDIFAGLSKGQFLSKTGSCKTWDSKADGYCRADGVGSIVLKRVEDAITDKNNILGLILSTATNHSADAISITHPHAGNQAYLYESVLHDAGVDPMDVSYVEMHGTGTQAGDMAEIRSVSEVFAREGARGSSIDEAVYIGAVKSNIGHGEAAAGIGALIKVLLMLQKNVIPRHIGIKHEINPGFPNLQSRNMRIPFQNTPWLPRDDKPRTAFLNNFSAAGGNTAMLIQEYTEKSKPLNVDSRSSLPFVTSAKSLSSLQRNIQRLVSYIKSAPDNALSSLSYTLTSRRMHHNYRVGVMASNLDELASSFSAKAEEANFSPVPSSPPNVTFVFTGQGTFYARIAKTLLEHSRQFRSNIQHLDALVKAQGFQSFLPALTETEAENLSPTVIQLALVCVQIALVNLWQSWGVKISLVVGHSLGEYAALYAAGVLSMEDTVYLVGIRARLLEEKCTPYTHAMLAVKASVADVESAVQGVPFDIACLNSPSDTVLSGSVEEINTLAKALSHAGIHSTHLSLPFAFHSAQIEPILERFKELASGVVFNKPRTPIISPLLGEVINSEGVFNPSYLCRHARELVDFADGLHTAKTLGFITDNTIFLEVGPHPICARMVKNTLSPSASTLASLNKGEDSWKSLSKALCSLHCAGVAIDFHEFHREYESCHQLLDLPAYSFDNKNYWIDYVNDWCLYKVEPRNAKAIENAQPARPKLSTTSVHRITTESFEEDKARVTAQSDLADPVLQAAVTAHQVNNTSLFSSSIYADIALTLGDYVHKQLYPSKTVPGVSCGDMEVVKPLVIKNETTETRILEITVEADLAKGEARLRYQSLDGTSKQPTLHATCVVTYEDRNVWTAGWNTMSYLIEGRIDTLKEKLEKDQVDKLSRGLAYRLFSSFVDYGQAYQGMEQVIIDGANLEATSRVKFQTEITDGNFHCCPYWIDSVCHLAGFTLNGGFAVDPQQFVYISHGWKALRFAVPLDRTKTYNSYVKMQKTGENNIMAGDVYIFENGTIIGVCVGIKFQRIPRTVLNTFLPPHPSTATPVRQVKADKQPQAPAPAPIRVSPKARSMKKARPSPIKSNFSMAARVLDIISSESELPLSELQDECTFLSLGVDSLLSLQILGRLRESLDLDLPGDIFLECETVGQLKGFLDAAGGNNELSSSLSSIVSTPPIILTDDEDDAMTMPSTAPSMTNIAAINKVNTDFSGGDMLTLFRETISEQMGIALEEVVGSNDLLSLGIDSLMSICILGIIREKTELDLDSDFFLTHNSVDAIAKFLRPAEVEIAPKIVKERQRPWRSNTNTHPIPPQIPLPRAVSILMQGKPRTATKKLFLFPDGSGSATSYASIPAIDPSVAVYGLNCPYMTTPELFTNGIAGVATQYLEEVRRRQPVGPYHLGGWSAGGVVAYEITRQLLAQGEHVDSLILLDSPCPIDLEPLPARLHNFFADIGLLGSDDGTGAKIPSWLLPHFDASIKALTAYNPKPIPARDAARAPRTLAIWARHGVCRYPHSPRPEIRGDEPRSMNWLLNNRTDFGTNGWERLLGSKEVRTENLDGNHFTLMKGKDELRAMATAIKDFL